MSLPSWTPFRESSSPVSGCPQNQRKPGSEFRLFRADATLPVATAPDGLGAGAIVGVGAIPLVPDDGMPAALAAVLARLLNAD